MAFGNIAGRAGFVIGLDKSELDRGLPQAERQFDRATAGMAASATRAGDAIGSRGGVGTAGLVGRMGLITFAASSAVQGLNEVQQSLQVTGSDMYRTEGRARNLGSELLNGNLIGGLKALAAQPKTLAELGLDARGAAAGLSDLKRASDAFGGSFTKIYDEAKLAAAGVAELDAASKALLQTTLGLRDASGRVVVGALPSQQLQVAGNQPLPSFGTPIRTRSQNSRLEGQLAGAQRADDLAAQERILEEMAAIARRRVQIVKQEGPLLEQRRKEEQAILGQLDAVRDQQVAQAKAAKAASDAEKARLAAEAKAAAERARAAAELAAANRKAAIEQGLENDIARAALTKRKSDDRKAFDAAIDYWRSLAKNAKNAKDREDAQAVLIDLRGRRSKALAAGTPADTSDEARQLRELRLANNVARAALTKRTDDDKRFLTAQLNYYLGYRKELLAQGEKLKAAQQTATIIGIRGQLAGLTSPAAQAAVDFQSMAFQFLQSLQGVTNQFGSTFNADGSQIAAHTWRTSKLTEGVVAGIDRLARATAHPGAKYARMELMEAYGAAGGV